jgi:catechol 2,3-dioxygenase-like lactoylglutathione lyase family enzyme
VAHALLQRLHNPHGYQCGCDPDCWCRRTTLGRAFRWWFPARWFRIHHKNAAVEEWKRTHSGLADAWKQEHATTSTVSVVGYEPCFAVTDVARSTRHFRRLGFEITFHDEGYAFAHRGSLTIHLAHSHISTGERSTLYLHVDDADQLAAEWRAAGFEVDGPEDTDYGKREGSHRDPDGNLIRFGSPLRRPRT